MAVSRQALLGEELDQPEGVSSTPTPSSEWDIFD